MVDVGFPGTLPRLLASLKRKGIVLGEIAYLLVAHYHPDRGGLAQELMQQGVHLVSQASPSTRGGFVPARRLRQNAHRSDPPIRCIRAKIYPLLLGKPSLRAGWGEYLPCPVGMKNLTAGSLRQPGLPA